MPPASPARPAPDVEVDRAPGRRRWPWVVGILAAVLVVYLATRGGSKDKAPRGAAAGKGGPARAIPVVGMAARTGDLGVYITGLGTVTAVNTVTIRSRVDGQLVRFHFTEGQLVHQGEALAEIDPRPFQVQLMQAEGQKAKDEAGLKNARTDLARYQALLQQDAIPRQQYDTQAATVSQFEAALQTDQGQIESAKLNLAYSHITAPITGRVGLRFVDPGNIIHANDPNGLVVLTQVQPIAVLFTIPADRLPAVLQQIRAGRRLPVEAWDRDLKNKIATGTLLAVDNQIDQGTGTVRLKAIFSNEDTALFSNQFVNARLLVDTLHQVVLAPAAAVQKSPQSTFVYVVKPDTSVEMRPVEVQMTEGDVSAIRRGLASGEVVVTDGIDKLQPGFKVALSSPAGSGPPPGAAGNGAQGAGGRRAKSP
jgi:multidrug efflux system membrane fusion protein